MNNSALLRWESGFLSRFAVYLLLSTAATAIAGCAGKSGSTRQRDSMPLIDARTYAPNVEVDLQYQRSDNVTGRPLYPREMPCLLYPQTAGKLGAAAAILEAQGYQLVILDAWRPPGAHWALWEASGNKDYLHSPDEGWSLHVYGVAVDVTLNDSTGRRARMPSAFDDFSPRASRHYQGLDPEIHHNLEVLHAAMEAAGFSGINDEWWHFYDNTPTKARPVYARELKLKLPIRDRFR